MVFGDQIYRQTKLTNWKHHECSPYTEENFNPCHPQYAC